MPEWGRDSGRADRINEVKFGRMSPTCRVKPRWGEREKRKERGKRTDGTEKK